MNNPIDPDVIDNRAGGLSERQVARLKARRESNLVRMIALSAAPVILYVSDVKNGLASDRVPGGLIICVTCTVVLALFTYFRYRRQTREIDDGGVAWVQGTGYNGPDGFLHVADRKFRVDETILRTIKDWEPYCVYYLPHSGQYLSLERIDRSELEDRGKIKRRPDDVENVVLSLGDDGELIYEEQPRRKRSTSSR